ncbi:hypothetical protein GH714_009874 [Hevea brasiliensis]|uniref:Uncharacterized protein n=1 Tax=Hevea brasiliensis TaxID=3981 RepID=A0A6A6LHZ8_HEVBR|nr:hypothetical protein GH714_009874 [Hevea brasiliensis]
MGEQLRRICRTSGVQVSFDTTNTRDSFYRASVDYVLKVCSSAPSYHNVIQIDGEDAQRFIAGLAENIGLENIRAARMVSAAVAARTRSCFLQAWALEVQGKHSEAVLELSKICLVLRAFPLKNPHLYMRLSLFSGPEMEMVARGLGKHLKVEQRELLMDMYVSVCSEESHRSAADALGLGTMSFGAGFFFVVIGWPILGMILEAYGFIVLFSGFWPTLAVFLQRIPILGWVFQQPFVRSFMDRYRGRRVPV